MVKCINAFMSERVIYKKDECYLNQNKSIDRVTVIGEDGGCKSFSYDEMKKYFTSVTKEEEFELLKQAAKPMIDYLNKFYNPMTSAVITEGYVKIVAEEMGMPLEVRD